MVSTVDRQDADLFFNSQALNYAVEILFSFFFMGHRGEKEVATDLGEPVLVVWWS